PPGGGAPRRGRGRRARSRRAPRGLPPRGARVHRVQEDAGGSAPKERSRRRDHRRRDRRRRPAVGGRRRVSENPRHKADELRERGLELLGKGRFAEALALYDESLREARQVGDPAFVDWIFACRAAAAAEEGASDSDLLELKKILLRTTDHQTAFRASYTGARIYELHHDFKRASFYSRLARQHAEALGDPRLLSAARNQLGTLLTADSRF